MRTSGGSRFEQAADPYGLRRLGWHDATCTRRRAPGSAARSSRSADERDKACRHAEAQQKQNGPRTVIEETQKGAGHPQ